MNTFIMLNGNILIQPVKIEEKTKSGIILTDDESGEKTLPKAKVIASSEKTVPVGSVIIYSGRAILIDKSNNYYALSYSDIISIIK